MRIHPKPGGLLIKKVILLIVIFCIISIISSGCLFSNESNDNSNKKLTYSISVDNLQSKYVFITIYMNENEIENFTFFKGDFDTGIGTGDYEIEPGNHKLSVIVTDENNSIMFNKTHFFDVETDFMIEIQIKEKNLEIDIVIEKPIRKYNNAPKMKEGKYLKLNNTTYKFSVIYIDEDNDEPEEAKLFIYHDYYDKEGNLRSNCTTYNLEYKEGYYKSGALFEIEISEFSEDDDYRFAFHDGYDMAHPLDHTPYTDP